LIYTFSKNQNAVVFIVCEGNKFQGALDKVWKLNEVLMKEPGKVHQNAIKYNIEMVDKNTTIQSWQTAIDNQVTNNKMRFTTYFLWELQLKY
jgi:hypothetical protein